MNGERLKDRRELQRKDIVFLLLLAMTVFASFPRLAYAAAPPTPATSYAMYWEQIMKDFAEDDWEIREKASKSADCTLNTAAIHGWTTFMMDARVKTFLSAAVDHFTQNPPDLEVRMRILRAMNSGRQQNRFSQILAFYEDGSPYKAHGLTLEANMRASQQAKILRDDGLPLINAIKLQFGNQNPMPALISDGFLRPFKFANQGAYPYVVHSGSNQTFDLTWRLNPLEGGGGKVIEASLDIDVDAIEFVGAGPLNHFSLSYSKRYVPLFSLGDILPIQVLQIWVLKDGLAKEILNGNSFGSLVELLVGDPPAHSDFVTQPADGLWIVGFEEVERGEDKEFNPMRIDRLMFRNVIAFLDGLTNGGAIADRMRANEWQ